MLDYLITEAIARRANIGNRTIGNLRLGRAQAIRTLTITDKGRREVAMMVLFDPLPPRCAEPAVSKESN